MGWNLFSKQVTDENICFLRDVAFLIADLAECASADSISHVIPTILKEKGLWEKFKTIDSYSVINDCYPRDREKLMDNIDTLILIVQQFNLNENEKQYMQHSLFKIITKMRLTRNEQVSFIEKFVTEIIYEGKDVSQKTLDFHIQIGLETLDYIA